MKPLKSREASNSLRAQKPLADNSGPRRMKFEARMCIAALTLALGTTQAMSAGRSMDIVNYTDFEIVAFFSSHKNAADWGADMLDGLPIVSDETRSLSFEDGSGYCLYSFKAVFDDGDELVSEDINICDLPSFTYY